MGSAIPLPRTGPAPGAVSRRAAWGQGFLQTRPNPLLLRVQAAPCGLFPRLPGPAAAALIPLFSRGFTSTGKRRRDGARQQFLYPRPCAKP